MKIQSKTISQVAQDAGIGLSNLKHIITKLLNLELIEALSVDVEDSGLGDDFFPFLKKALLKAVGPMADVILEDALADMGATETELPAHMAAELINMLTEEIPRDEKRTEFLKIMIPKIPK